MHRLDLFRLIVFSCFDRVESYYILFFEIYTKIKFIHIHSRNMSVSWLSYQNKQIIDVCMVKIVDRERKREPRVNTLCQIYTSKA